MNSCITFSLTKPFDNSRFIKKTIWFYQLSWWCKFLRVKWQRANARNVSLVWISSFTRYRESREHCLRSVYVNVALHKIICVTQDKRLAWVSIAGFGSFEFTEVFFSFTRALNCKIETPSQVHCNFNTFSVSLWCRFEDVSRGAVWTCVWDISTKGKCEVRECSTFGKVVVYVVHSVRLWIQLQSFMVTVHIISMLFGSPASIIPCLCSVFSNLLQYGRKFIYKYC